MDPYILRIFIVYENSTFIHIGIAAHIHAAAPGGPRYLETMTREERKHITNGIWLCSNHAKEIDSNTVRDSAEILQGIKNRHEADETLL
jgi:hypothetical protein